MNRPATESYSLRGFSRSTEKGNIRGIIVFSFTLSSTIDMYITVKLRNNKELFRRKMKIQS